MVEAIPTINNIAPKRAEVILAGGQTEPVGSSWLEIVTWCFNSTYWGDKHTDINTIP